jgi:thiamine biosynthesis protein ThiS
MVTINGTAVNAAGKTVSAYLQEAGYEIFRIAVEHNLMILSHEEYESTILHDGDTVEIVNFVGGG